MKQTLKNGIGFTCLLVMALLVAGCAGINTTGLTDPLPSWQEGPAKEEIFAFVGRVTAKGGPDFVAPADRIADFDNDGTLWVAQPLYTQFAFAIDRVKALAGEHPQWQSQEPFSSVLSGGGVDFMRVFAEAVYGIPREQVIGSRIKVKFELRDGEPLLVRLPEIDFIDDKEDKPVGINQHIGKRPIAAFGNSDGNLAMLQWTAAGSGPRLCLFVHHTDAEREWAYDRDSHIGRLDKGLDEARAEGWTIVDMKRDWKQVFP